MSTSAVIWNRIEPIIDAETTAHGLAAPIADPLWLLGRQWQVGELTAEDAGTPVAVTVATSAFPIDRLIVGSDVRAIDGNLPLEALVEPEPPAAPDLRLRLTAGRDLAAALVAANCAAAAAALPAFARPPAETDRDAAALIRALGARAVDGEVVAAAITTRGAHDVAAALASATATTAEPVLARWHAGYLGRTGRAAPTAWSDPHAAYRFQLRAAVGDRDVVLAADDYRGGRLDWCDFTATTDARATTTAPAAIVKPGEVLLPVPLEFAGGPARRFFEIERSGTSFAMLAGAPPDVATALLLEVALVFGGDWFVAPAPLPVSALGRVDKITVTNSFGDVTELTGRMRSNGWRMFECSAEPALADFLAIVPTVATTLEGPAIEAVVLGIDESSNVVWAIEDTLGDALGLPRTVDHVPVAFPPEDAYRYLPFVPPPPSYFPLVPRRAQDGATRFVAATMRSSVPASTPSGRVLAGWPNVGFIANDVPNDGLRIERRWQFAIGRDGTRALWITREDHVGRGAVTSGAIADALRGPG